MLLIKWDLVNDTVSYMQIEYLWLEAELPSFEIFINIVNALS